MLKASLVVCWGVFFTQYSNAFMLTAFFPESPLGAKKVGSSMVGAIFAACPFSTCLSIPIPPLCVERLGIRVTVALGLLFGVAGSLLCGLVPVALPETSSPVVISAILLCCRALSGVGAALAEAGCFTALSSGGYGARLGLVMSSCEVVIGLGASIGTALGGVLYELGEDSFLGQSWRGSWRLPFMVSAASTSVLLPLLFTLPSKRQAEDAVPPAMLPVAASADASMDDGPLAVATAASGGSSAVGVGGCDADAKPSLRSLCSARRAFSLASLFAASAVIEAGTPILQPYASQPPLSMHSAKIGLIVSIYSFCYMGAALPLGALTDRLIASHSPLCRIKMLAFLGWLGMAAGFALLGPVSFASERTSWRESTLVGAMIVGGTFSAAVIVPSLPELQLGLNDDDEASKALLCSLWNGMYSGGGAMGPLATSSLYGARGFLYTTNALLAFSACVAALVAAAALLYSSLLPRLQRCCGRVPSTAPSTTRRRLDGEGLRRPFIRVNE